MEGKKNKTNGVNGILIVIIVILLGVIAFCAYKIGTMGRCVVDDSNLQKGGNTSVPVEEVTDDIKNTTSNTTVNTTTKIGVTEFYPNSVAIVNDGSVYVNVYGTTTEIDNLFGNDSYKTLVATRNSYKEHTFNNFVYYIENQSFYGMKLNTNNVERVYTYEEGQALNSNYGLILLNNDGTLSIISLYSLINGKTDVKKIELSGIKNVISEDNEGMTTYAIKQNGEKVNLKDYIPTDYKQF